MFEGDFTDAGSVEIWEFMLSSLASDTIYIKIEKEGILFTISFILNLLSAEH